MMNAPRIAIPLPTSRDEAYNRRCWAQYAEAVRASGGVAVAVALDAEPAEVAKLAASCQAILLPGSPADVQPQKYGQEREEQTARPDSAREAVDELLLQDAFNLHKPILGVCYGLQSMNVWKGGSLVQHLQTASAHQHGEHSVRISMDAPALLGWFGGPAASVNSSHHQAVSTAGDGLIVAAVCPEDGTIEALVGQDAEFVVGVQWHPERTFTTSAGSRALFAAFVQAAARNVVLPVQP